MKKFLAVVAILSLVFSPVTPAFAATTSWDAGGDGSTWSDALNWNNGVPDAADDIANLTLGIGVATTVTVDGGTSRTVGVLNIGDDDATHAYLLNAAGAETLTFDNTAASSQINQIATSAGDTISVPIIIANNAADMLTITNLASTTLTISGTVDGDGEDFNQDLTVTAGTGSVTFSGILGGTDDLGDVLINSALDITFGAAVNVNSITQVAGTGDTQFDGLVTLEAIGGMDITTNTVTFNAGVNTLAAGNDGTVTITNAGLLTIAAAGDMFLDGAFLQDGDGLVSTAGDITTTDDNITFTSGVTLTGNVALDTGGVAAGNILFSSTIATGGNDLTLDAGPAGNITLTGALTGGGDLTITDGAVQAYNDLTVNLLNILDATTSITFGGDIAATTTIDVVSGGTIVQNGAITSGTNLDYDAVGTIGINDAINVSGTVDIDSGGVTTIGANGDITAGGAVTFGAVGAGTLTTAGDITTTNDAITFTNGVTLTGAVALNTGAGAGTITFGGVLDGTTDFTENLTLTAGTGNIDFDGIVGGTNDLGDVTINSAADVTADAAFSANTIIQVAGTGDTQFDGLVTLEGAGGLDLTTNTVTLNAGINTLAAGNGGTVTITNAGLLTITGAGDMSLDGAFLQNGAGLVSTAGDITTTNDNITFTSAITQTGDVKLTSGTAAINLAAVNNGGNLLTIDSDGNSEISGALTGAGGLTLDGDGTMTLSNAATAYTGNTIVNAGKLVIGADMSIGGNVTQTNAGGSTLDVGTSALTIAGAFTLNNNTLNVTANGTTSGSITTTAGVASLNTGTLNITVEGYVPSGTTYQMITSGGGAMTAVGTTIADNSFLLDFTLGATGLVTAASSGGGGLGALSTSSANANAAGAALAAADTAGATGDMATVLSTLQAATSSQAISDAIETMTPDVSSGSAEASRAMTNQGFSMISNRLGGTRSGAAATGVSSGDMSNGVGVWIQGLGSHMKQGERKGIEGYSANMWGTTIGADKLIDRHWRAGLAGGYGWSRVHSKQPGTPSDDINSWQATLYGSYDSLDLCEARAKGKNSREAVRNQGENLWYVDGMLAFTQNDYDSRREIWLTPTTRRLAKADHYSQQYSTKFEAGYKFFFEETKDLEITPFAGLGYNFLYMNDYKEKGADALNLNVDGEGFHQLEQSLGTKLAYPIVVEKTGTFVPSVKAAWLYDYIGDRFVTNASFQGGGTSFETKGAKPAKNGMLFGAELAFLNKGNVTLTGNWDILLKDQFMSNTYYGTVRYDF